MSSKTFKSLTMFGAALLAVSCSIGESHSGSSRLQDKVSPTPQATEQPSSSPTPTANSPIRLVDFDNTAYPNFPDYSGSKKKRISLKPGEGGPNFINYGDITGDGAEEAMAVLGVGTRGSAIPYYVYIFTMDSGKPELIWDFETGDRADGGLRNIYSDHGDLVVELYGKGKVLATNLYADDGSSAQTPYPYYFTQTRYKWDGSRFKQNGAPVVFSDSTNYGSPVMPLYRADNPSKH
jgi:hypothetical protein